MSKYILEVKGDENVIISSDTGEIVELPDGTEPHFILRYPEGESPTYENTSTNEISSEPPKELRIRALLDGQTSYDKSETLARLEEDSNSQDSPGKLSNIFNGIDPASDADEASIPGEPSSPSPGRSQDISNVSSEERRHSVDSTRGVRGLSICSTDSDSRRKSLPLDQDILPSPEISTTRRIPLKAAMRRASLPAVLPNYNSSSDTAPISGLNTSSNSLAMFTASGDSSLGQVKGHRHRSSARLSVTHMLESTTAGNVNMISVKEEVERKNKGLIPEENTPNPIDYFFYILENFISAQPHAHFMILFLFVCFCVGWQGTIWYYSATATDANDEGEEVFGANSFFDTLYFTLMILVTGQPVVDLPDENGLRWVYFLQALTNVVVISVLIGFMTEAIHTFMASLSDGRSKVFEDGHILILDWSEATVRLIIQIAFLRRQYQMINEQTYLLLCLPGMGIYLQEVFKWCGWLERPSTPLAWADIVILTKLKTKEEMHDILERAMLERGIDPRRTRIGHNVICRVGDPTNPHDLIRVGAHRASSIITMMTETDIAEYDLSHGKVENGATLRSCLALRHVLFQHHYSTEHVIHPDLRIVLQMTSPSVFVDAACFKGPTGSDVIIPMEITLFLNSLMFSCAAQPGLAKVILTILDFEGKAIRRRKAVNLRAGRKNEYGGAIGMTFRELQYEYTKAVFIGILNPKHEPDEIIKRGYGLCPDPDTIISEDDMLIFIGPKSSPERDDNMVNTSKAYNATAKELVRKHSARVLAGLQTESQVKLLKNVLVCGWRRVWSSKPDRLRCRIMEIAHARKPGSWIIFVNGVRMLPQNEEALDELDERILSFHEIMEICGFRAFTDEENAALPKVAYKRVVYEVTDRDKNNESLGIFISHVQGDAADPSTLEQVLMTRSVHTAIVLGTQATTDLPAYSRDTRVLSIMLLLRKLVMTKTDGVPIHVVGENHEDMTSRLALGPEVSFDHDGSLKQDMYDPDFINTQAIYARVLAQTLAYPNIRHAIKDLFDEFKGSADLVLVEARHYLELNIPLKWGVVQHVCLEAVDERTIAIGYIGQDGLVHILPPHFEERRYSTDERLVVLRRYHKLLEELI